MTLSKQLLAFYAGIWERKSQTKLSTREKRRVKLIYAKGRFRENRKITEGKQVDNLAQKVEYAKEIS